MASCCRAHMVPALPPLSPHPLDGSLSTIPHLKRWNSGLLGGFVTFFSLPIVSESETD